MLGLAVALCFVSSLWAFPMKVDSVPMGRRPQSSRRFFKNIRFNLSSVPCGTKLLWDIVKKKKNTKLSLIILGPDLNKQKHSSSFLVPGIAKNRRQRFHNSFHFYYITSIIILLCNIFSFYLS